MKGCTCEALYYYNFYNDFQSTQLETQIGNFLSYHIIKDWWSVKNMSNVITSTKSRQVDFRWNFNQWIMPEKLTSHSLFTPVLEVVIHITRDVIIPNTTSHSFQTSCWVTSTAHCPGYCIVHTFWVVFVVTVTVSVCIFCHSPCLPPRVLRDWFDLFTPVSRGP